MKKIEVSTIRSPSVQNDTKALILVRLAIIFLFIRFTIHRSVLISTIEAKCTPRIVTIATNLAHFETVCLQIRFIEKHAVSSR
jgi:hypothetical protein